MKDKFKDLLQEAGERKILFVEGKNDKSIYEILFENEENGIDAFEKHLLIYRGKDDNELGKAKEIKHIKPENNFIGIIDRDTMTDEEVNLIENDKLFILPRYTIENFIIKPSELWEIDFVRTLFSDFKEFENAIEVDFELWKKQGAFWRVVYPLYQDLISNRGFNKRLRDISILRDDKSVMSVIKSWQELLNPEEIFNNYNEEIKKVNDMAKDEIYNKIIIGKDFFEQNIANVLRSKIGTKGNSNDELRLRLFKKIKINEDLQAVIDFVKGHL